VCADIFNKRSVFWTNFNKFGEQIKVQGSQNIPEKRTAQNQGFRRERGNSNNKTEIGGSTWDIYFFTFGELQDCWLFTFFEYHLDTNFVVIKNTTNDNILPVTKNRNIWPEYLAFFFISNLLFKYFLNIWHLSQILNLKNCNFKYCSSKITSGLRPNLKNLSQVISCLECPPARGPYNSIWSIPSVDWLILGAEINHVVIVNNWKYNVKL